MDFVGRAESHTTDATAYNDKFLHLTTVGDGYPLGLFRSDGSLWVNDMQNYRILKFDSSQYYVNRCRTFSGYLGHETGLNNANRVVHGILEFSVDYTKPVSRKWQWCMDVSKELWVNSFTLQTGIYDPVIIQRYHAVIPRKLHPGSVLWQIVELVSGDLCDIYVSVTRCMDTDYGRWSNGRATFLKK